MPEASKERAVLGPSKQTYTARDTWTDGTEVAYSGITQPAIGIVIKILLSPLHIASTITKEERYLYYVSSKSVRSSTTKINGYYGGKVNEFIVSFPCSRLED